MAEGISGEPWHENHPEDERFDRIVIEVNPRWKESELSGDEWRFSYVIKAYRKGELIIQRSWSTLEYAVGALYYTLHIGPQDGEYFDREAWERTKILCDQPGCAEVATVFYHRKKPYTNRGAELVAETRHYQYRQFCSKHRHRGDCDLDDADHNYEQIPNPFK